MKQILRILLAVGVIAFAVSMTAVSCGKPDAGGGNNNNNNNSGGGGTPDPGADIKINITDAMLAKVKDGTNILLKLSAWTESGSAAYSDPFQTTLVTTTGNARKKAFEIVHDKASEGMLLVGKGNIASANVLTTPAVATTYPGNATGNEGIHIVRAATANQGIPAGLNFFSVFANKTIPTTAAQAAADAEPFAFTSTAATGFGIQPLFWCVANAPAITAAVAATDKLVGSHKADCLVAGSFDSLGGTLRATARTAWWGKTDPFKREFQVAVVAIQTDGKTIGELMPGADAAAKLANFNDGIGADDMKAIIAASSSVQFKKFNLKIVKDADF